VNGAPNESQAARFILKDYVQGQLCYVHAPPGEDVSKFNLGMKTVNKKLSTKRQEFVENEIVQSTSSSSSIETGNSLTSNANSSNSRNKKKKKYRKHEEPTIIINEDIESSIHVVAHTKGKQGKQNFTRPQFQHTIIPVDQLKLMRQQTH